MNHIIKWINVEHHVLIGLMLGQVCGPWRKQSPMKQVTVIRSLICGV